MQIFSIDTGLFKLDGGAMFGVVPKVIWQKQIPADENNLCTWSMRCLLVIDEGRKILIDTGMGNKQSEKFFSHYYPSGEATLLGSLDKIAIGPTRHLNCSTDLKELISSSYTFHKRPFSDTIVFRNGKVECKYLLIE